MSKSEISKFLSEAHEMWLTSSKIEQAAVVIFILSILFIITPSKILSDLGNIMQVIFWVLFIYIVAKRGNKK